MLKYKCASFYILKGPEQITCTDGQWTNPPVCLGRWKLVLRGPELCELLVVFLSGPAGPALVKQRLCWGCDADRAEEQLVLLLCRRNFLWRSARVAASAACSPSLPPVTCRSRRVVWSECKEIQGHGGMNLRSAGMRARRDPKKDTGKFIAAFLVPLPQAVLPPCPVRLSEGKGLSTTVCSDSAIIVFPFCLLKNVFPVGKLRG